MSRIALNTLVRAAFALVTTGLLGVGCSRQAEGERCDLEWAGPNQDCASGLVCKACGALSAHDADRCCPADGTYTDSRCAPAVPATGDMCSTHKLTGAAGKGSTSTGSGGSSGTGGTGEPSTGGTGGTGEPSTGGTGGTDQPSGGGSDQAGAGSGG
jgi:hypothetical protein